MEDKQKHTPGPWEVFEFKLKDCDGVETKDYFLKNGEGIVFSGPCFRADGVQSKKKQERAMANAALIAAAPELLDALKEAVLEFGCHTHMLAIEQGECNGFIHDEWRCTLQDGKCFVQRWLAAIRKAEGL